MFYPCDKIKEKVGLKGNGSEQTFTKAQDDKENMNSHQSHKHAHTRTHTAHRKMSAAY